MRVLAIDPGYGRCGVAILEHRENKEVLLYSDCVETSARDEFADRLATIADVCARLIQEYKPTALAIEKLYFSTNQKTAMRVSEVRGALIETATRLDIPVFEYTPAQVKSAATGSGRADKRMVANMVRALVQTEKSITRDDEYDAIAIGITHFAHVRK